MEETYPKLSIIKENIKEKHMLDQICSPCIHNSHVIQNKSHGPQFLATSSLSVCTHFNTDI